MRLFKSCVVSIGRIRFFCKILLLHLTSEGISREIREARKSRVWGPRSIDCRIADILRETRARVASIKDTNVPIGYSTEAEEARRVRDIREGGDLALNPDQVIHLHLEFRLRAYM